jgi:hypothetical protein
VTEVVEDPELDEFEPEIEDPSRDWSPLVYRTARLLVAVLLLALLVTVGLGFGRVGPLAAIGRVVERGLTELEVLDDSPSATTPPPTTRPAPTTITPSTTTIPPPVFDPLNGFYGSFPTSPKPDITEGATGEAVLYLEAVLVQRSDQPLIAVDDVFGPDTTAGVQAVQGFFSLPQTGVVDAATWQAIDLIASQPAAG